MSYKIYKSIKTFGILILFFSCNIYTYANPLGSPSTYTDGRLLITAGYHDNSTATVNNKGITVIGFSNGDVKWISSLNTTTTSSNWYDLGIVGSDLKNPCVKQITATNWGDVVTAYTGYDGNNLIRKMAYWRYKAKSWEILTTVGLPNEDMLTLLPGDATYYYVKAIFKDGVYGYNPSTKAWSKLIAPPAGEYIYSVSNQADNRNFAYATTANKIYTVNSNFITAEMKPIPGAKFPPNSLTYLAKGSENKLTDDQITVLANGKTYFTYINTNDWRLINNPAGINKLNGNVYLMKNGDTLFTGMPSMYLDLYAGTGWKQVDSGINQQENQTIYDGGIAPANSGRSGIDITETGVYYTRNYSAISDSWFNVYSVPFSIAKNK